MACGIKAEKSHGLQRAVSPISANPSLRNCYPSSTLGARVLENTVTSAAFAVQSVWRRRLEVRRRRSTAGICPEFRAVDLLTADRGALRRRRWYYTRQRGGVSGWGVAAATSSWRRDTKPSPRTAGPPKPTARMPARAWVWHPVAGGITPSSLPGSSWQFRPWRGGIPASCTPRSENRCDGQFA